MKNILFIEVSLNPTNGGVERVSYTLSQSFIRQGNRCFFLYCINDTDLISSHNKLKFDIKSNSKILYSTFESFINHNKIDIVICQNIHSPKFQRVYKQLREKTKIKLITTLHSNPDIWLNKNMWGCSTNRVIIKEMFRSFLFHFKNPYKEQIIGMYKISDYFVLLSESYIPIFKRLYKVQDNASKLVSISNPCSFNLDTHAVNKKENIVLVVSRMAEQQKRISNILRIWKEVEDICADWRLLLVGDGPDFLSYLKMSKMLHLKNIEFVGHSKDVTFYYQKSKIFLMTSIWEGLPMTLIEAQYYGCVPIAFNSFDALNDIIVDGVNGYISQTHNINDFSKKLRFLMEDKILLERMSIQGISNIQKKFQLHQIIDNWNLLFCS